MKVEKLIKLIFSISICQLAGVMGSIFTAPSIPVWYETLQKPYFSPPNWIFAPVWILLFTLMGISLYLILIENLNDKAVKIGIAIFSFQLILNIIWSFLFFSLQNISYALFEIMILWLAGRCQYIVNKKSLKKLNTLMNRRFGDCEIRCYNGKCRSHLKYIFDVI